MKRFGVQLVLILILAGFIFVPGAHAAQTQTTESNILPSAENIGTTVTRQAAAGQTGKEIYSLNSIAIQMGGTTCFIRGCSGDKNSIMYYGHSAVAGVSNIMLAMYTNPPADFMAWVHSTAQDLGFEPKTAYAQGIGFTGLSALLPIWRAFRNISYALLAMVMIVIGFMIMFRQKIDPKTVVTVQNALPKIVLALLLITFSYAIAAFMIDLMYLLMAIVINLLVSSSGGLLGADTTAKYISGGFGTTLAALFRGGISSIDDTMRLFFYSGPVPWYINASLAVTTGTSLGAELILISLIVAIALIFGIIRIAFLLISAYIQILLSVLVAPFQLMTEALPGSTGFSSWIKNLVANLAVFPITGGMLLVGTILTQSNTGNIWAPPLLNGGNTLGPQSPLGAGTTGITGIIGLGILLAIPSVANGVKESLKAKAPVNAGLGAIFGPIGSGMGQAFQLGYQGSFVASMFLHKPQPSTPLTRQVTAGKKGPEALVGGEG